MERITVWQLRELNGDFGLACQIGADRLKGDEIKYLTDLELLVIRSRLTNERLKEIVETQIRKRKLFRA